MKVVCNSSVLIALINTGSDHILAELYREITIPEAVREEVFGARELPEYARCMSVESRTQFSRSSPDSG